MASPALELVHAALAGVNRWVGNIGGVFDLYRENIRLKEEVARLRQCRTPPSCWTTGCALPAPAARRARPDAEFG
ncbi:MAG: hypothetical protein WDM81_10000 [Rhizomicrobium sp.]